VFVSLLPKTPEPVLLWQYIPLAPVLDPETPLLDILVP
jgi:hypothetical protein